MQKRGVLKKVHKTKISHLFCLNFLYIFKNYKFLTVIQKYQIFKNHKHILNNKKEAETLPNLFLFYLIFRPIVSYATICTVPNIVDFTVHNSHQMMSPNMSYISLILIRKQFAKFFTSIFSAIRFSRLRVLYPAF